jgi:TRAP-type mannitol/chloroaromatic compound transport system permease small subunit
MQQVIRYIGRGVSWLSVVLVLVIVVDVLLRYFFNVTSAASFELEWHLFAALFMLSAAWTLQQDRHVRVDLFYQKFSQKGKAWVNLIGMLLFLLPFCWVAATESMSFVASSFAVNETSPDPGGLPARYLIKSIIPISFFLLFIQGVMEVLKSISIIAKSSSNEIKAS